jgi:hypothetical protein
VWAFPLFGDATERQNGVRAAWGAMREATLRRGVAEPLAVGIFDVGERRSLSPIIETAEFSVYCSLWRIVHSRVKD